MSRRFALHIGLNTIDATKYTRKYKSLRNAENDAIGYHMITKNNFDEVDFLKGGDATSGNLSGYILKYASKMDPGDFFLLTYSGHGSRIRDTAGEESDGWDEVLVLYDRLFLDDEFEACWARFQEGTRILLINDSCYNGTISRVLEENEELYDTVIEDEVMRGIDFEEAEAEYFNAKGTYDGIKAAAMEAKKEATCSIINIAGCQDNQLASDGTSIMKNGLFTSQALTIINDGSFGGSVNAFFNEVVRKMPPYQTPNWDVTAGVRDQAFESASFISLLK